MLVITINDMGRNRYSYALAQNGKVQSIGRDAGVDVLQKDRSNEQVILNETLWILS